MLNGFKTKPSEIPLSEIARHFMCSREYAAAAMEGLGVPATKKQAGNRIYTSYQRSAIEALSEADVLLALRKARRRFEPPPPEPTPEPPPTPFMRVATRMDRIEAKLDALLKVWGVS